MGAERDGSTERWEKRETGAKREARGGGSCQACSRPGAAPLLADVTLTLTLTLTLTPTLTPTLTLTLILILTLPLPLTQTCTLTQTVTPY